MVSAWPLVLAGSTSSALRSAGRVATNALTERSTGSSTRSPSPSRKLSTGAAFFRSFFFGGGGPFFLADSFFSVSWVWASSAMAASSLSSGRLAPLPSGVSLVSCSTFSSLALCCSSSAGSGGSSAGARPASSPPSWRLRDEAPATSETPGSSFFLGAGGLGASAARSPITGSGATVSSSGVVPAHCSRASRRAEASA